MDNEADTIQFVSLTSNLIEQSRIASCFIQVYHKSSIITASLYLYFPNIKKIAW